MTRLLSAPNSSWLAKAVLALVARYFVGWLPFIGKTIGIVLLLVAVYFLARVTMNMLNKNPSPT